MGERRHNWRSESDSRHWLIALVHALDEVAATESQPRGGPGTPEALRAQLARPAAAATSPTVRRLLN